MSRIQREDKEEKNTMAGFQLQGKWEKTDTNTEEEMGRQHTGQTDNLTDYRKKKYSDSE